MLCLVCSRWTDGLITPISEISRPTGLARNTVTEIYHDRAMRYDRGTLAVLCHYFGVGVGDLLVYAPDEPAHGKEKGNGPR